MTGGNLILICLVFTPIIVLIWNAIADILKKTSLKKCRYSVIGCLMAILVCLLLDWMCNNKLTIKAKDDLNAFYFLYMAAFAFIGMIRDGFGAKSLWVIPAVILGSCIYNIGLFSTLEGIGWIAFWIALLIGLPTFLIFGVGGAMDKATKHLMKSAAQEIGGGLSHELQELGVKRSTADAIGYTAAGVAVGVAAKAAINGAVDAVHSTYSDAVNSTSYANNSTNYVPDGNPDLVHVDGYYRQDGTYVHSHVRTSPNNNVGDNISAHK